MEWEMEEDLGQSLKTALHHQTQEAEAQAEAQAEVAELLHAIFQ
jgi:hypothetical protein